MLVIRGELDIDIAKKDEFLAAVKTFVELTHAENGCNAYNFSADLDTPGRFHIVEEWADDDTLQAHMRADHFRIFGRAMRGFGVSRSEIFRYEVSSRSTFP